MKTSETVTQGGRKLSKESEAVGQSTGSTKDGRRRRNYYCVSIGWGKVRAAVVLGIIVGLLWRGVEAVETAGEFRAGGSV
jgi:hypothetical protein